MAEGGTTRDPTISQMAAPNRIRLASPVMAVTIMTVCCRFLYPPYVLKTPPEQSENAPLIETIRPGLYRIARSITRNAAASFFKQIEFR
jgi:hypothetical protein